MCVPSIKYVGSLQPFALRKDVPIGSYVFSRLYAKPLENSTYSVVLVSRPPILVSMGDCNTSLIWLIREYSIQAISWCFEYGFVTVQTTNNYYSRISVHQAHNESPMQIVKEQPELLDQTEEMKIFNRLKGYLEDSWEEIYYDCLHQP